MKNRTTVEHGMLPDLEAYLLRSGWKLEPPVGAYEVAPGPSTRLSPAAPHSRPHNRRLRLQYRRTRPEGVRRLEEEPAQAWAPVGGHH